MPGSPAHAGIDLGHRSSFVLCYGFPRTRGDRPVITGEDDSGDPGSPAHAGIDR